MVDNTTFSVNESNLTMRVQQAEIYLKEFEDEVKRANYSLAPITSDPWHDGTRFYSLYLYAAKALGEHCYDFVHRHGKIRD